METSNSTNKNTKKIIPFMTMGILIIICFAIIFFLWRKINFIEQNANERITALERNMNAQKEAAQNLETQHILEDMIDAVFEERSSSIRGNEDLGSICLKNVCQKMLDAGNDMVSERVGFSLGFENISDLEDSLFDTFIAFFENEGNYNAISSAITKQSRIIYDNIEIDGDRAYAHVTVNYIDVYDVCMISWEDLYGEDTVIDILLSGETGILSLLSKLKQGGECKLFCVNLLDS